MALERYVTTVADALIFDKLSGELFAYASLRSSTFSQTINNVDIRGGVDAMLKLVFSNQKDATLTLEDVEYKLETIALQNNVPIIQGSEFFGTEKVEVTSGNGTVTKTPLPLFGGVAEGWVSYTTQEGKKIENEKVTFVNNSFSLSDSTFTGEACVQYVRDELNARSVTVTTATKNRAVAVLLKFRETLKETGNTTALTDVGEGQLYIPNAIILQDAELAFTMDAASSQKITIRALSNGARSINCKSEGEDLYIVREYISSGNWYDDVIGIGIDGGDDLTVTNGNTINVKLTAYKNNGTTITLNTTDRLAGLTISTSNDSIATATGDVISGVAKGTTNIQYLITEKPNIFATANITVE